MNWHRWRWLNEGLLPVMIVILRLCWLWPWLELLHRWLSPGYTQPFLPMWAIIALFLGATLVARMALAQGKSLTWACVWVAGMGLVAVVGVLWWQYARTEYSVIDPRWVAALVHQSSQWGAASPCAVYCFVCGSGHLVARCMGRPPASIP